MKKILVVDDQADVREVLSDFLILSGFSVSEAANGRIALKKYQQDKPDAAVVDVEMPVMNGLQFSKTVLESAPDFPIIIITGFLQKYTTEDITKIGVRRVLNKPIDLNKLRRALNEMF